MDNAADRRFEVTRPRLWRHWPVGGAALAAAAVLAVVLAFRSKVYSIQAPCAQAQPGSPRSSSPMARATATTALPEVGRAVALAKPFQAVSVVAEDEASRPYMYETRDELFVIYQQLCKDYGVTAKSPVVVQLASDEAMGRRVMAAMGQTPTMIAEFFAGGHKAAESDGRTGTYFVVYLPNAADDPREYLAFCAAASLLRAPGELGYGRYPYWFFRGFELYVNARFSSTRDTYTDGALRDVRRGVAPSLASITSADDGTSAGRDDFRSEAAVKYLSSIYGAGAVGRLLNENASGTIAGFSSTLQSITKMAPVQFNDAVSAWLVSNAATATSVPAATPSPTLLTGP